MPYPGQRYAFFAAVLEEGIDSLTLENGLSSYENIVKTRFYDDGFCERLHISGLLDKLDLPDLVPALERRAFRSISPKDINIEGETEYEQCRGK